MMALALVISTARGAQIAFLGGLALLALFYLWDSGGKIKSNQDSSLSESKKSLLGNIGYRRGVVLFFLIIIIVSSFTVFYGTFWKKEAITDHLPGYFSSHTIMGRLAVWDIAWSGIKENQRCLLAYLTRGKRR